MSKGCGWLWDPPLKDDISRHWAGCSSGRVGGTLHQLSQSMLEGMAVGTFFYITFLRILPQEIATSEQRVLKVILLLAGFALLTGLLLIQI